MSIISISATKAQKDGAKYLFGTKGESILAVLEALSKAKELRSSHLNGLILMLKDAEDDELIAFKNSAGGKRTIEAAKLLATAKTLGTSLQGLRKVKVPSKWIQDHDDAKAAGATETKTHKATGKGTRPQKAEQVANPQAPEPETVAPKSTPNTGKFKYYFTVDNVKRAGLAARVDAAIQKLHPSVIKEVNGDFVEYSVRTKRELNELAEAAGIEISDKGVATSAKWFSSKK